MKSEKETKEKNIHLSEMDIKEKQFATTLDSLIQETLIKLNVAPGIAVACVKNGKTMLSEGYGYTDVEKKEPVTDTTLFYIASTTKSFTGLMAAVLHEKEILPLNTTLESLFPKVPWHDSIYAKNVTTKHLLAHTSNIHNGPLTYALAYNGHYTDKTLNDLVKYAIPREEKGFNVFNYDNTGYNLFTLGLENEKGLQWKELLKKEVFSPLKMNRTTTSLSVIKKNNWQLAQPHAGIIMGDTIVKSKLIKTDKTLQSAGGMFSTAKDLTKWLKANLNPSMYPELKNAIELSHEPIAYNNVKSYRFNTEGAYGLGWYNIEYNNKHILFHPGGYPGYRTLISFSPDLNLGVAIMANGNHLADQLNTLITRFTYDYWDNREEAFNKFNIELNRLLDLKSRVLDQFKMDRESRSKRKWTIDKTINHTGIYKHPYRGQIEVVQKGDSIQLRYGNLISNSEPSSKQNAVRVEFIPFSGENISFIYKNGHPLKLVYREREFVK